MAAQIADDTFALCGAGVRVADAKNRSRTGLVKRVLERKAKCRPAILQAGHGPASQDLRQLLHVLLGVAAIDAQGVQLEQLACVILVEPACPTTAPAGRAP